MVRKAPLEGRAPGGWPQASENLWSDVEEISRSAICDPRSAIRYPLLPSPFLDELQDLHTSVQADVEQNALQAR